MVSIAGLAISACASDPASPGGYAAAGWPQLQHDAARTGHTEDDIAWPATHAWEVSLVPERITHVAQAIAAGGKVFLGTEAGAARAFALNNGAELWQTRLDGPICHAAAASAEAGVVAFTCLDGFVYGLDMATGAERWKVDTGFGISTAPALYEGAFIVANRRGDVLSLNAADGAVLWQTRLSGFVFASPAAAGGRVFVATEDMRMQSLDARTGALLWRSEPLPSGMSFISGHPVVHRGKAFIRVLLGTNRDASEQLVAGGGDWSAAGAKKLGDIVTSGVLTDDVKGISARVRTTYERVPLLQSMYVFDAETGARPYIPAHWNSGTLNGPSMPPCVCPEGMLVVPVFVYRGCFARMDPDTGDIVDLISAWYDPDMQYRGSNLDENASFSSSARTIFFASWHFGAAIQGGGAFQLLPERGRIRFGSGKDDSRMLQTPQSLGWHEIGQSMFATSNCDPGENAMVITDNHLVWSHYPSSSLHVWKGAEE